MRVLFVVSWYTAYDAEKLAAGVLLYAERKRVNAIQRRHDRRKGDAKA